MADFLLAGWAALRGKAQACIHSRAFHAMFHLPVLGGFLTLSMLPYILTHRKNLAEPITQGITAQLIIPGIFSVASILRYFVWLLELDLVNEIMRYALVVYLVAGYALMTYNGYRVWKGKRPAYKWLQKPMQSCAPLIFS